MNNVTSRRRSFRVAPELRRCCYYGIIGCLVSIGMAWWLGQRGLLPNAISMLVILGLVAICLVPPLFIRLDIDEAGITKNTIFTSELWSWADFESGRISKLQLYRYSDSERPWWRRKLKLGSLSDFDREYVIERINQHYKLPECPHIPEELQLELPLRGALFMTSAQLKLRTKRDENAYDWHDIDFIHIHREDEKRRDFHRLQIVVNDVKICLRMSTDTFTTTNWNGPPADVVSEFTLRHCPPEKLAVTQGHDDIPYLPAAIEFLLRAAESAQQSNRRTLWLLCLMFMVLFGCMAAIDGMLVTLVMFAFSGLFIVPVFYMLYRSSKSRLAEIEARYNSLDKAAP